MVYTPQGNGSSSANHSAIDQFAAMEMSSTRRLEADQFEVDQMEAAYENIAGTGNLNIGLILNHEAEALDKSSMAFDRQEDQLGRNDPSAVRLPQSGDGASSGAYNVNYTFAAPAFPLLGNGANDAFSSDPAPTPPYSAVDAFLANNPSGAGRTSGGGAGGASSTDSDSALSGTNNSDLTDTQSAANGANGADGITQSVTLPGTPGTSGLPGTSGPKGNPGDPGDPGDPGQDTSVGGGDTNITLNTDIDIEQIFEGDLTIFNTDINFGDGGITIIKNVDVALPGLELTQNTLTISISPDGGIATGVELDFLESLITVNLDISEQTEIGANIGLFDHTLISLNDPDNYGILADLDAVLLDGGGLIQPELSADLLGETLLSLNSETDGQLLDADISLTNEDGALAPDLDLNLLGETLTSINNPDTDGQLVDADLSLTNEDGALAPDLDINLLDKPIVSLNNPDTDGQLLDADVALTNGDGILDPSLNVEVAGHNLLSEGAGNDDILDAAVRILNDDADQLTVGTDNDLVDANLGLVDNDGNAAVLGDDNDLADIDAGIIGNDGNQLVAGDDNDLIDTGLNVLDNDGNSAVLGDDDDLADLDVGIIGNDGDQLVAGDDNDLVDLDAGIIGNDGNQVVGGDDNDLIDLDLDLTGNGGQQAVSGSDNDLVDLDVSLTEPTNASGSDSDQNLVDGDASVLDQDGSLTPELAVDVAGVDDFLPDALDNIGINLDTEIADLDVNLGDDDALLDVELLDGNVESDDGVLGMVLGDTDTEAPLDADIDITLGGDADDTDAMADLLSDDGGEAVSSVVDNIIPEDGGGGLGGIL